jgi:hypothetical protein
VQNPYFYGKLDIGQRPQTRCRCLGVKSHEFLVLPAVAAMILPSLMILAAHEGLRCHESRRAEEPSAWGWGLRDLGGSGRREMPLHAKPARTESKFIDDHVAPLTIMLPAPMSKAGLPLVEIGTATGDRQAGPNRLWGVWRSPAGAAPQPVLSTGRELYWQLGCAVWPTEASVQGWRRSDGEVAADRAGGR